MHETTTGRDRPFEAFNPIDHSHGSEWIEMEPMTEIESIEVGSVWIDYIDLALKAVIAIAALVIAFGN